MLVAPTRTVGSADLLAERIAASFAGGSAMLAVALLIVLALIVVPARQRKALASQVGA